MITQQKLDSNSIRGRTIELSCNTGAGHLAPSLSTVEILTVLFRDFLNFKIGDAKYSKRDRFILSKGHGSYAYYIILNELGFIPSEELTNFYTDKSLLKGCLTRNSNYMIEASTGSLGHGLPISVGVALALKIQKSDSRVICLVGDGEMQEGSNYEALIQASRFKLDNLLIVVDANGLQAMDKVSEVGLTVDRQSDILRSFCEEDCFTVVDGHNENQLRDAYSKFFNNKNPSFQIILCKTIKGKGLPLAENRAEYHFRCPTEDGYDFSKDDRWI